jgi:hypothetical protein
MIDEEKVAEFIAEKEESGIQVEVKFTQTFGISEVSDSSPLGDFADIVPSTLEQANIINSRLKRKQKKFAYALMENDNFTPVEGIYDLSDAAAAVAERKSASPETKAARALSKIAGYEITPEALASILAAMNPAQAQGAQF